MRIMQGVNQTLGTGTELKKKDEDTSTTASRHNRRGVERLSKTIEEDALKMNLEPSV